MDKLTKRSGIFMIVIALFFILLIPLEVFIMNKADAINTQLLLMQAAGNAGYTDMMTVKTWLNVALVAIGAAKVIAGVLCILLGITILNRSRRNKENKIEIEKIESDIEGEKNV